MGMTETGNLAFRNASVSKINFSSTITEISPWSFYGCNFVKLEIPETITKINIRGFANCTALQEVTVHNPTAYLTVSVKPMQAAVKTLSTALSKALLLRATQIQLPQLC